jgi:hypothetical protein
MSKFQPRDPLDIPYLRISQFADAINGSRSAVRKLISEGKLRAVKDASATKIVETPRQHLESLPPFTGGGMKAGPGRPRRQPEEQPPAE